MQSVMSDTQNSSTTGDMSRATRSPRQQAIIECIALGEVSFATLLGGFYFNRLLQFEFAPEDQAYLNALYASGKIWHKPIREGEYEVRLQAVGPEFD